MAEKAYIGLGSNLANPVQQLQQAYQHLTALKATTVERISSFYRSRPMGELKQPDYINAVMKLETELPADTLLDALQSIENRQGRIRDIKWGPRTLDLDILLYSDCIITTEYLTVPHPGLQYRAFVLYPLAEIAPELSIPGLGPLSDLLRHCPQEVWKLE